MKRISTSALIFSLGMLLASAFTREGSDWRSLVETEKAFARAAAEKGIRSAFLEYLAGGALVFRPEPTPGRPLYEKLEPGLAARLVWKPAFAEISASGDMGYTTGPYEIYKDRTAVKPSGHGHYVTIWQRPAAGEWKAALDIGISHAAPRPTGEGVGSPAEAAPAPEGLLSGFELEQAKQKLRTVEAGFSKLSASQGTAKAYQEFAADRVRVYREGNSPVEGLKAALRLLAVVGSPSSWAAEGADVSASADLGYTYGTGRLSHFAAGDSADRIERAFSYVHIWRKAGDGTWQVVLDVAIPYPSK